MKSIVIYLGIIITVLMTMFLSGCAVSQGYVEKPPMAYKNLNRFKYVVVFNNTNKVFISPNSEVENAFRNAGIIPIDLDEFGKMEMNDKIATLTCSYNYYLNRYGGDEFYNLFITLEAVQLGTTDFCEVMKFKVSANSYGKADMYNQATSILKRYYQGYDENLIIEYLRNYIDKIESDKYRFYGKDINQVKDYLDNNLPRLNQIEGIWSPLAIGGEALFDRSRIAIISVEDDKYDYYAIVLDENFVWYKGEIRVKLRKTVNSNVYSIVYNTDTKLELPSTAFITSEGLLELSMQEEHKKMTSSTYIKDYPNSGDMGSSSVYETSVGSGFLISAGGYVATNLHVVKNSKNVYVISNDGSQSRLSATIELVDENNDICILKVPGLARALNAVRIPYGFEDTTNKTGESVFCMGYPLTKVMGNEIKVTNGIISSVTGYQGDVSSYQISAPAQPGNSGGPLFNSRGNVIGIVNAKIENAENVSYAVKISYLKNLVGLLDENIVLEKKSQASTNLSSMVENFKSAVFIIEAEY